ncbi:hypothetical protein Q1W73_15570 [Asticcacaulis sp. ZE23SCel15]|uniref:hypothetical protein n=1 Tax=Asticcacaulis sp. ZE23SCel15 TaxID=3059027 RepID=UPI00265F43A1|nr:hypothetical protein [Asticcacaulis sp. ZE23SCel15]WKL57064.1 hypothetical protein Q1W73_15570 [Asticcacaulis sp. ZE23SCel15]
MDTDTDITDAEALKMRRLRLRAFADRLLEAVEMIPMPDSFLEAERAHKAVRACDAMLVQLYGEPAEKLSPAPRSTAASGASRRPSRDDADDDDLEGLSEAERIDHEAQAFLEMAEIIGTRLDRIHKAQAEAHGFWPDGTPYDESDPNYGLHHFHDPQINANSGMDDHCPGCWPNGIQWALGRAPKKLTDKLADKTASTNHRSGPNSGTYSAPP